MAIFGQKNADYIHLLMNDYYEDVSAHYGKPIPLGFGRAINPNFMGYHFGVDYAEQLPNNIQVTLHDGGRFVEATITGAYVTVGEPDNAYNHEHILTTFTGFEYRGVRGPLA